MHWLKKLGLFSLVIIIAAIILGYVRYKVCFLIGVQGLFVGMLLGAIIGKLGTEAEEIYSFRRRLRLSLGFSALFMVAQSVTVSTLFMEQGDHIFTWIGRILDERTAEYWFSSGQTGAMVRSGSGKIEGVWWLAMTIGDGIMFAFSFLMGLMLGLPSSSKTKIKYRD